MTELVLDASVVLQWLREDGETHSKQRALERRYRQGAFDVIVPSLLFLELLDTVARRWLWPARQIRPTAHWLLAAGFRVPEPPLSRAAHWAGNGLTAYDARYVALAEERRTVVITADERMLAVVGAHARPLAAVLELP